MSDIIKRDVKKQSNTLLPKKEQNPLTLDKRATPGLVALQDKANKKAPAINQTGYLTGLVLANISPPNSDGKTKYRLPHLNMESGKYLEDFLVKAIVFDEATLASLQNPEDIFIKASKLTSGAQAKFEFDKNNPEHTKIWKEYFASMTQHVTLAPKYVSGFFGTQPKPGTQIKIYLFQAPYLTSGHSISGLYEVEYNTDIFNQGYSQLTDFFKSFHQKYIETIDALKRALGSFGGNLPSFQAVVDAVAGGATQTVGTVNGPLADGNVTDTTFPHIDTNPLYVGDPSSPSAELYNRVIDQYDVANNPRHQSRWVDWVAQNWKWKTKKDQNGNEVPNGNVTFCDLFVMDVTYAMGTPIPFRITSAGDPLPMTATKHNGMWMNAPEMLNWCHTHGQRYGWKQVNGFEAQEYANKGFTTVCGIGSQPPAPPVPPDKKDWPQGGMNHIGIVRPGKIQTKKIGGIDVPDPWTAQAGFAKGRNPPNNPASYGFGGDSLAKVRYYTCLRTTRYTTPTEAQLQRLDQLLGRESKPVEVASTAQQPTQQQENPADSSSEMSLIESTEST